MYDLIIIGGGPAGVAAAIYAKRAMMNFCLIERGMIGGQIALTHLIENYPGIPGCSGMELAQQFEKQLKTLEVEIKTEQVEILKKIGDEFIVKAGEEYKARSVIWATGATPRQLKIPKETELIGRGVSYCATCDGPFFKDKVVVVVGGGDTAVKEAEYLAKIAKKVYIVHRRGQFRAEKVIQEKVLNNPKIEVVWNSTAEEIQGEQKVEKIVVKNVKDNNIQEIECDGIFIFIGYLPNTREIDCLKDEKNFIKTNQNMQTSVPGLFAVGDCREKISLQVATAVGDGVTAQMAVQGYLEAKGFKEAYK